MKSLLFSALALLALALPSPAFSHSSTTNHPLNGTQMAISDNTFDAAELDAALTANPALKDHVLASVKKLGFTPYTKDEFDSELGKQIGAKTSELYTGLDNDIFTASGIAKEGTEKTYDYAKRVIGGLKSAPTALQQKITDLEQKIAQGSGDATLKAQLEAAQAKEQEYQTKLQQAQTESFQKDVKLDVRDGLRGLKFDPTVKESVRNVLVDNATAQIISMAKVQDNADGSKQVVYVKDGKTLLNKENLPADASFILSDLLKDVLDTGHQGQGGGAGRNDNGSGLNDDGTVKVPDTRPATVTTKMQVNAWLLGLGVKKDTKQFDEAYAKHSQGLPLQ